MVLVMRMKIFSGIVVALFWQKYSHFFAKNIPAAGSYR
jgi:hypothetical protein